MSLPTSSLFLIPALVLLLFMPDSSLGNQGVAEEGGGAATINCLNCSNCQYPCHPQSPPPPPPPPPPEPEPPNPPPPPCPPTPVQCCQNSPPQMPPYNYIPPPPQIPAYNYNPPPPNPYAYLPYNNFSGSVPLNSYMHYHPVVLPIAALLQLLIVSIM